MVGADAAAAGDPACVTLSSFPNQSLPLYNAIFAYLLPFSLHHNPSFSSY